MKEALSERTKNLRKLYLPQIRQNSSNSDKDINLQSVRKKYKNNF